VLPHLLGTKGGKGGETDTVDRGPKKGGSGYILHLKGGMVPGLSGKGGRRIRRGEDLVQIRETTGREKKSNSTNKLLRGGVGLSSLLRPRSRRKEEENE